MRKVDFFGDKEYIVHVTNSYTVFRFPDGSKTRLETCKEQLVPVLGWYRSEMQFYDRMQRELNAQYEKQKEVFDTSSHYYTRKKLQMPARKIVLPYSTCSMRTKNTCRSGMLYLESSREHLLQEIDTGSYIRLQLSYKQ